MDLCVDLQGCKLTYSIRDRIIHTTAISNGESSITVNLDQHPDNIYSQFREFHSGIRTKCAKSIVACKVVTDYIMSSIFSGEDLTWLDGSKLVTNMLQIQNGQFIRIDAETRMTLESLRINQVVKLTAIDRKQKHSAHFFFQLSNKKLYVNERPIKFYNILTEFEQIYNQVCAEVSGSHNKILKQYKREGHKAIELILSVLLLNLPNHVEYVLDKDGLTTLKL